jgi:HPt (histidine-containing phosphotransfer) domain-containing protein
MPPAAKKPARSVHAVVEALTPQFLSGLKTDIAELEAAAQRKDYAAAQKIGHAIKGSASLYEQTYISELGKQIEHLGQNQGLPLTQLTNILKTACTLLEQKYPPEQQVSSL